MKWIFFILAVVASIPAAWQILTPGYFPMHDNTQVVRVQQMHKALGSGQFPVRWVPDLGYGYGYPIFNFYNPLPYYVGAGFMFLGLDALAATKTMMTIGVILAGVSMFLFAKTVLKGPGPAGPGPLWLITALVASTLYVYAPYHAVQIYVRGAVAEYWAYALLPLVFWAFLTRRVVFGAFALAALILSHNLTSFIAVPFIALLFLTGLFFRTRPDPPLARSAVTPEPRTSALREREAGSLRTEVSLVWGWLLMIGLALGLSSFFWIPAIVESSQTRLSQMVFQEFDPSSKHLVTFSQLWNSPWGYGGSSAGLDDGMSFEVGKIQLIGSIVAMAIWLHGYIAKRKSNLSHFLTIQPFRPKADPPLVDGRLPIFLIIGFVLSIFLMLPASSPIWDAHPIFSYIQFPWRLLTFASLFASILTAMTVLTIARFIESKISNDELQKKLQFVAVIPLFIASYFILHTSYSRFQPQFKFPTSAAELTSRERIVWEVSKRSDEYLPIGFIRPKSLEEALRDGNAYNQQLVDEFMKPTFARRFGNLISFVTLVALITYAAARRTRTA